MKHDSTDTVALRNVGVECLYIAIGLLFLPRSLNILFRNLYIMNLILMTKYTLSTEFVLALVRGNNHWHWRTSQVRLKILNYRTLLYQRKILVLYIDKWLWS